MASRDIDKHFEIVVYKKELFEKHRCVDKGWNGAAKGTPQGQIICCKECGRHWYSKRSYLYEADIWSPVRWYHFRMRRAIVGK